MVMTYDTKISESKVSTYSERLEHFLSWKDHSPKWFKRGVQINPNDNVCVVKQELDDLHTTVLNKEWMYTHNLVTDDGDIYYALKGANETPAADEDFGDAAAGQALRTSAATPAKGDTYTDVTGVVVATEKIHDATYPQTVDPDADNTGDGVDVVTYRTSWTTGDFNDTGIVGGIIFDDLASPTAATKLLNHYTITSFDKTSNDTLKIFINHTMDGQP